MKVVSRLPADRLESGNYDSSHPNEECTLRDWKVELTRHATELLERLCSPVDECFVIDELEFLLPSAHRVPKLAWLFERFGLACQYTAHVESVGIEVRYIDLSDGRFLIIDVWKAARPTTRMWSCVLRSTPHGLPTSLRQH